MRVKKHSAPKKLNSIKFRPDDKIRIFSGKYIFYKLQVDLRFHYGLALWQYSSQGLIYDPTGKKGT